MTCKEKLMMEFPEDVSDVYGGGCRGRPHDYLYMRGLCNGKNGSPTKCVHCWNREIPETEPTKPETTIQDSGERTTFETGAVRDMHAGKGRMDLLPWEAIIEVAKHCEEGAIKYGEHNVDKGIPIHSLVDSGFRHLAKYTMGMTDEPHLRAAAWNLLWALYMEIKHPELQDLPTRQIQHTIWEEKTESGLLEDGDI